MNQALMVSLYPQDGQFTAPSGFYTRVFQQRKVADQGHGQLYSQDIGQAQYGRLVSLERWAAL
jgi:hypothetical protein